MKTKIICPRCGNEAMKEAGHVNRARKLGVNIYCSKKCFDSSLRKNETKEQKLIRSNSAQNAYRKTRVGLIIFLYAAMRGRKEVSFTFEFFKKFSECQRFDRLFNEWVASGYKKDLKPSIDRINNKLPYTERNIQWLTWGENRFKQRRETQRAFNIPIVQFKNGKKVDEYRSMSIAAKKLNLHAGSISRVARGMLKTTGGFTFKYKSQLQ